MDVLHILITEDCFIIYCTVAFSLVCFSATINQFDKAKPRITRSIFSGFVHRIIVRVVEVLTTNLNLHITMASSLNDNQVQAIISHYFSAILESSNAKATTLS